MTLTKTEESAQWKKISETIAAELGKKVSPAQLKKWSRRIREEETGKEDEV